MLTFTIVSLLLRAGRLKGTKARRNVIIESLEELSFSGEQTFVLGNNMPYFPLLTLLPIKYSTEMHFSGSSPENLVELLGAKL